MADLQAPASPAVSTSVTTHCYCCSVKAPPLLTTLKPCTSILWCVQLVETGSLMKKTYGRQAESEILEVKVGVEMPLSY